MSTYNDPTDVDDEHWLNTLAGSNIKDDASPDPATVAEAHQMRQALIRLENAINSEINPLLHRGPDPLLEKLRQQSLLPTASTRKSSLSIWWPAGWAFLGSLAILLVFGALAPLVFDRDQLPITASADQAALVMRVESPWQHAQKVAASIQQAGGKAHIRKQPNGHIMLYGEATPEVMIMMRQHNMNPPMDHGMFIIAFIPMQESTKPTPPTT
jgi:hypothetical protein